MEHWYVLHTKPKAEYQVVKALTQRRIHTYLPEIELPKTRQSHKPLFPSYLFARIDFSLVGISSIWQTAGLLRVVAFGGEPTPLPDEAIEFIRYQCGEIDAAGGLPAQTFKLGETIYITNGPFKD